MSKIDIIENRLTEFRIKKGLSMNELAKQINSNVAVISKIERGDSNPRPKTAHKICQVLGVTFDELFRIN